MAEDDSLVHAKAAICEYRYHTPILTDIPTVKLLLRQSLLGKRKNPALGISR